MDCINAAFSTLASFVILTYLTFFSGAIVLYFGSDIISFQFKTRIAYYMLVSVLPLYLAANATAKVAYAYEIVLSKKHLVLLILSLTVSSFRKLETTSKDYKSET